eukprot:scaffold3134_cov414-Prasinococcus_capsulatus_cf.AAC.4
MVTSGLCSYPSDARYDMVASSAPQHLNPSRLRSEIARYMTLDGSSYGRVNISSPRSPLLSDAYTVAASASMPVKMVVRSSESGSTDKSSTRRTRSASVTSDTSSTYLLSRGTVEADHRTLEDRVPTSPVISSTVSTPFASLKR